MTHSRIGSFVIDGRYIQDHYPGIGRYTYNLIDALARVAPDERFTVLHNPALKNTRYDLAALAKYPNLDLHKVAIRVRSLEEQCRLPFAMRHSPFAVFHSPYYIKPYFLSIPSIVTIFDLIPLRVPNAVSPTARLLFRFAIALAIQTSARVIVPSQATRGDLVAIQRGVSEKIAVIPLAADARFKPRGAAEIARVREKYGLPARYALYVGINKPHKNLQTLIDAWRVADRGDAALVIAGAWDARYEEWRRGAGERGRRGDRAIVFIRDVPDSDLPALYSGAAVFVLPSLYEGFGLPLLEAMACGAPVLASNASSLPEVGGDPSAGSGQVAALYFDPRDVNALAQLLTRVLDDAALRDDLCGKSRARAAGFSWERAARETLAVYRQVPKFQCFNVSGSPKP